jgi:hypothetical protein
MARCLYCFANPYGNTENIGVQVFNDKTISAIKLNTWNPHLLTGETWNIPDKGANHYSVIANINYCPMCGRKLKME